MQDDLERLGVGSKDDQLSQPSVQRLGRLVRTLFDLLPCRCLVEQVQDLLRKFVVSLRPSSRFTACFLLEP